MLSTLREASRILGLSAMTLCHWRKTGLIRTDGRHFGMVDVLAAAVGRDLRRKGFDIETAAAAMSAIQVKDLEGFRTDWSLGKRFLVGCGPNLVPWLLRYGEVFGNEFLPLHEAISSGLPIVIVDTERAYEQLQKSIAEYRAGKGEKCGI